MILCFVTCMGCLRVDADGKVNIDDLVASFNGARNETEVGVQNAVDNAAASERAIMFVHVDWASMQPQQQQFAQFIIEYHRKHSATPVMFHYVDCTPITDGYSPLRALPGWQELEADGQSLIHGWGELVWIERGRVLHVERIINFKSASELVNKTEQLMSLNRSG